MTSKEIENIIKNQQLPKDELDTFKINLWGFIILTVPTIFLLSTLLTNSIDCLLLYFAMFFLGLTVLFIIEKLLERNLKKYQTNNSLEENKKLINIVFQEENLNHIVKFSNHYTAKIPSKGNYGYKLTLIPQDKVIYYNIRFIGSIKGRLPFLFTAVAFQKDLLLQKLKRHTTPK